MNFIDQNDKANFVRSTVSMAVCMELTKRISERVIHHTVRDLKVDKLHPAYIEDEVIKTTLSAMNAAEEGYVEI